MSGRIDSASQAAAIARVTAIAQHAAQIRQHLDEVSTGPAFRTSHRSQEFLRFVVERALQGKFDDLRERSIGIDLFGKPASYDTSEDAIVRVTASDVRKRLLQHYGRAGSESDYRIDLPSGSYIPEFRIPSRAGVEAQPHDEELDGNVVSNGRGSTTTTEPVERRIAKPSRLWAGGAALLVLGVLSGWLVAKSFPGGAKPGGDPISTVFHGTSGPIHVVVSDETLVLAQVMLGRNITLQEYENLSYLNQLQASLPENLQRFQRVISSRQIANMGDLQNAVRISERLRTRGFQVAIRHARQYDARDFRSGNFIILGSAFSNPWANLFQSADSNFPLDPNPPTRTVPAYINRNPAAGEPASFGVSVGVGGAKTTTYARVTLVENSFHTGRVLLVAGQSLSATELAGEYLFQAELTAKIRERLGLQPRDPLPNLEMILRVTELNQVGDSVELVSCKRMGRPNA